MFETAQTLGDERLTALGAEMESNGSEAAAKNEGGKNR